MRSTDFGRHALSSCAVAALLAGCGALRQAQGDTQPPIAQNATTEAFSRITRSQTFHFTGGKQNFIVPANVVSLSIDALGAAAGGDKALAAHGGRVYATLPVHSGERLAIFVGGRAHQTQGGYNGGGSGGYYHDSQSYGGGGATDVREGGDAVRDRILVAAGGGGRAEYGRLGHGIGGDGGGRTGDPGGSGWVGYSGSSGGGGGGGDQKHGGKGGYYGGGCTNGSRGANGSLGIGGTGGSAGECDDDSAGNGGAGGGGYYGGGGGGGGGYYGGGGGGGGGSSYVGPNATKYRFWKGWKSADGNGLVIIRW
jgi:hypothetical protein